MSFLSTVFKHVRLVLQFKVQLIIIFIIIQWVRPISTTLPVYIPALASQNVQASRENLILEYFNLGLSYSEIISFLVLQHGIRICLRQLKRVLRQYGLQRRNQHSPLPDVIDAVVNELQGSGSLLGYRAMHQRLRVDYGLLIDRETVRKIIKRLDPVGVDCRTRKRFRRRQYVSQGPNYIWHIDGYDKLKPFGFCIHGAIDGFSRRIMWLEVGPSNNDPRITVQYFIDCIRQVNGFPCLVRGDCGTENVNIAAVQRYLTKGSSSSNQQTTCRGFLYGKSVANQRIEAWWSILRKCNSSWWMNYFKDMRDSGLFDGSDPLQCNCLQFCFMPLIRKELYQVARLWNLHYIRKSTSNDIHGRPDVLYFLSHNRQTIDYKKSYNSMDLDVAETVCGKRQQSYGCLEPFGQLARMLMLEHNLPDPNNADEAKNLYNLLLIYISQI